MRFTSFARTDFGGRGRFIYRLRFRLRLRLPNVSTWAGGLTTKVVGCGGWSIHHSYTDNEVVLLRSTSCWDSKPLRVEYISEKTQLLYLAYAKREILLQH